MAISYKLGPGIYKISPAACLCIANYIWECKCKAVTPGTVEITRHRILFSKFGMGLFYIDILPSPLFVTSNGILDSIEAPPPQSSQAHVWAVELSHV